MTDRRRLLVAALLGTLCVAAGHGLALLAFTGVADALDDGGFLSGVLEAMAAGLAVLALTAVAAAGVVRWWVGRGGDAGLGWSRAAVVVILGAAAAWIVAAAGGSAGGAAFGVALALAPVVGLLVAYRVLIAWAGRAPSRG